MEDLVTTSPQSSLSSILERSFRGRRVLITGHNVFVGSWLSLVLAGAGADVTGLSLDPEAGGLADAIGLSGIVRSIVGDIRDASTLDDVVATFAPEAVFHLAAQSKVLPSYAEPALTFDTNVMGTVNVLEALRRASSARTCVVVTSDKCYAIAEGSHVETDPLGGDDPYSASKAGAEIVAHAYQSSFFSSSEMALATARAGNILGGGDWADQRIVPDAIRAARDGIPLVLRRPLAVRPWQHVLDAISGYLRLADALERGGAAYAESWNFGPETNAAVPVRDLVARLTTTWNALGGAPIDTEVGQSSLGERSTLILDSSRARTRLGWRPLLNLDATVNWTVEWYHAALNSASFDAHRVTSAQIRRFLELDEARALRAVTGADVASTGSTPR